MTEFRNPIAEKDEPDSGNFITPFNAYQIKGEATFYCPDYDCKDPERKLFVKKSILGNCFYSHRSQYEHEIRPETLLHKSAIKWFIGKEEYEIPSFRDGTRKLQKQFVKINPKETECEFRRLQLIIPDVKLKTENDFEFAIEVVVTSDIGEDKSKLIREFNLPTIRVDLTKYYHENKEKCHVDYIFIQGKLKGLMYDSFLKSWVVPPDLEKHQSNLVIKDIESTSGCLITFSVLGLLILIKKIISGFGK